LRPVRHRSFPTRRSSDLRRERGTRAWEKERERERYKSGEKRMLLLSLENSESRRFYGDGGERAGDASMAHSPPSKQLLGYDGAAAATWCCHVCSMLARQVYQVLQRSGCESCRNCTGAAVNTLRSSKRRLGSGFGVRRAAVSLVPAGQVSLFFASFFSSLDFFFFLLSENL